MYLCINDGYQLGAERKQAGKTSVSPHSPPPPPRPAARPKAAAGTTDSLTEPPIRITPTPEHEMAYHQAQKVFATHGDPRTRPAVDSSINHVSSGALGPPGETPTLDRDGNTAGRVTAMTMLTRLQGWGAPYLRLVLWALRHFHPLVRARALSFIHFTHFSVLNGLAVERSHRGGCPQGHLPAVREQLQRPVAGIHRSVLPGHRTGHQRPPRRLRRLPRAGSGAGVQDLHGTP